MLIEKLAYGLRWVETPVDRSSQKLIFVFFLAYGILAYDMC
jgi:hypothetical protein